MYLGLCGSVGLCYRDLLQVRSEILPDIAASACAYKVNNSIYIKYIYGTFSQTGNLAADEN